MKYTSIFNDVLGPVMRGPSSSHCAAALRIGRLCRDLMGGTVSKILVEFDPNGSLATTHKGQGSDMGLFGGLLGWEAHDPRLTSYEQAVADSGMDIHIAITELEEPHPNAYQLTLYRGSECRHVTAISTGGGMIEIVSLEGAGVSLHGDYYEVLVFGSNLTEAASQLRSSGLAEEVRLATGKSSFAIAHLRTSPPPALLTSLSLMNGVDAVRVLRPVLPVRSRKKMEVPFTTAAELLQFGLDKSMPLWELGLEYESMRGGISKEEVILMMENLVFIMEKSIRQGIRGTHYEDRILGPQSVAFKEKMEASALLPADLLNHIVHHVSVVMEVKSSMGVIVAAPTAGSCGVLPGSLFGYQAATNASHQSIVRALSAAGMIGVLISAHSTFAAEVAGCQAECGSASSMTAAALVSLAGGSLEASVSAASFALQNSLGMICDPIANRVEAPCLGKNVMAASNALSCANMALAGYDHLIPLDEVIHAMNEVSEKMAHQHRCTGLGGLAITPAAKEIEERMNPGYVIAQPADKKDQPRFFKVC